MTLYKDDVIQICPKDGTNSYRAVCAGFSATNNKIDIQPTFSAESIEQWVEKTNPEIIDDYTRWFDRPGGQNYVSINALFKDNYVFVVKVSPDGRIEHR